MSPVTWQDCPWADHGGTQTAEGAPVSRAHCKVDEEGARRVNLLGHDRCRRECKKNTLVLETRGEGRVECWPQVLYRYAWVAADENKADEHDHSSGLLLFTGNITGAGCCLATPLATAVQANYQETRKNSHNQEGSDLDQDVIDGIGDLQNLLSVVREKEAKYGRVYPGREPLSQAGCV